MQLSHDGVAFLKEREGFKTNAYKDSAGIWTIGYGTIKWQGKPVEAGMTISEPEAELAMVHDLAWAQTAVNKQVKVKITQHMFDALVSFVYNVGEYAFNNSTLLRLLNKGEYLSAADQFLRWKFAGGKVVQGLLNRRILEKELFLQ